MAKRRRRRSRKSRKSNTSIKGMVRKFVNKATAPVVFWQQLTSKDYSILNADQNYRNADIVTKLKVGANLLTAPLSGQVIFKDQYNPTPNGQPRINPGGVLNKWVGIAIAGKIYGAVGKTMKLPESGYIDKLSNKIAYSGIVGGFFDNPPHQQSGGSYTTGHITPVITQNRAVTRSSAMQYDLSTQGALR